jgi:hypothetical protein
MEPKDFRILGLAGSLRRASFHRGIVRAAREVAPQRMSPDPQMLIPYSRQKFDAETGDLVDEETCERLRRFLSALAEWTRRYKEPVRAHQRQARDGRT